MKLRITMYDLNILWSIVRFGKLLHVCLFLRKHKTGHPGNKGVVKMNVANRWEVTLLFCLPMVSISISTTIMQ